MSELVPRASDGRVLVFVFWGLFLREGGVGLLFFGVFLNRVFCLIVWFFYGEL